MSTQLEFIAVKAVTDGDEWALDVLGVPFGGPDGGRDSDGEYFDAATNIYLQEGEARPAFYYHGLGPDGYLQNTPTLIGQAIYKGVTEAGHMFRVTLDKAVAEAKRIWDAARDGLARASSGSVNHLVRVDPNGHLREWPLAELSLIDADGKRQPANQYAVAVPALKASFEQAGIPLPDIFSSDGRQRGKVGG